MTALATAPPPAPACVGAGRGSDFARLCKEIKQAGLLRRRRGYYSVKISLSLGLFAAGWVGFGLIGRSWYQLLVAGLLAFAFTHVAFLGHDAGHRQIFRSRRANDMLGVVHANLLVGLSWGWWLDKHSRHHAHPNTVGADPDIGDGPLAFTADQARDAPPPWAKPWLGARRGCSSRCFCSRA